MTNFRPLSAHEVQSKVVVDRCNAARSNFDFLPVRNFGGVPAYFSVQALHHFFGNGVVSRPHQQISKQLASRKANMKETGLMQVRVDSEKETKRRPADYVEEAAAWAKKLTEREEKLHGSKEAALGAVARKTGVNASTLWSLRYRKPKDLYVSVYMALKNAYERELERQRRLLEHEIRTTGRLAPNSNAVREAQTLLDAIDGEGLE